jgi:uncharacterized membrane protein YfcA
MGVGTVLAVVVVVLAASTVQTVTGFGFALFAVPLLSFAVDTKSAVVLTTTLGLAQSGFLAVHDRAHADRATARRMLAGVALGSPVGFVVLDAAPERALRGALAVALVLFVIVSARGLRIRAAGAPLDVTMGAVSGVLGTSLGTNGPPLVTVLHARHLPADVFRATLAWVFAVSAVLAVALFAVGGRYDADTGWLVLASVPALGGGVTTGRLIRPRLAPDGFRRLVLGLVVLTALASIVAVLTG